MNKTAAPRLRFPEFQDSPEWEEKAIKEIFDVNEKPERATTFDNEKIITVKLHALGVVKNERNSTLTGGTTYFKRRTGEFIFSKIDLLNGAFGIVPNELDGFYSSTDVPAFRFKNKNSSAFFLNWLKASYLKLNIERTGTSSTLKRVSPGKFLETLIYLPSIDEQQKIADCLTALDELISAQSEKVAALGAYKKGLMQNLFPAEGESVPRLRFPEFESAGEWEEVRFGDILQINSGKGFKASEYSSSGIRLLQIENVGYGKVKWSENTIYLSKDYVQKYPELVLQQGDIVLALNRPVTNNELKIAQLKKHDEPSLLYQRVGKVEKISNSITENFIFHLCQKIVKNFVIKQSIGSDQPFISLKELYAQMIFIPTPPEQQRIAELLGAVDEEISAQGDALAGLKVHKRGLMQGLFP